MRAVETSDPPGLRRKPYLSLFTRVAGMNALLLIAATALAITLLAPHKLSAFTLDKEVAVLVAMLSLMTALNLYLLRRLTRPLRALTNLARRVDLTGESERLPDAKPTSEAGELALTFNGMLDRLQAERREATGRVLAGQEAERLRIARELHDQVGQELTAILLVLSRLEGRVPGQLRSDVIDVQDAVRSTLQDVRRISIELRPEALDDLGLASALAVLAQRLAERSGLVVVESLPNELPRLAPELELVVYRVAQEALTNVARHSGSDHAELRLEQKAGHLILTISDRGRGLQVGQPPGSGMRGMQERASLIGATLDIADNPTGRGCVVRLDIPATEDEPDSAQDPHPAR